MDCRNCCVHGSRNKSDADCEPERIRFLTEALEFVFAVLGLVEAGGERVLSRRKDFFFPFAISTRQGSLYVAVGVKLRRRTLLVDST